MIAILDYGTGNLASVKNMLRKIGFQAIITSDIELLMEAEKIILPGVGAFDNAMERIESLGFDRVLHKKALIEKIPILGICLGMQIMTEKSEEGTKRGLGWISGDVRKFNLDSYPGLKVPHIGWNDIQIHNGNSIFDGLATNHARFYFVHSYKVVPASSAVSIGQCNYGGDFCGAFQQDNLFGVQFHPEKSHKFGMALMKRFVEL
jgi:glutamine amidotransferase